MGNATYTAYKYELLKYDTVTVGDITLYRIKALKDSKF